MQIACSIASVNLIIFILITQQRNDAVKERREQLTRELAMITERKKAKTFCLLKQLRRDILGVKNRRDVEASKMSTPEAPVEILDAIRSRHGKPSTSVDEPPLGRKRSCRYRFS